MTDKKTEALKLALEALGWTDEWRPQGLIEEAITAIREALAEQPAQQQEPYAWMAIGGTIWRHKTTQDDVPLYTSPPASKPWVGLDDADLDVCDTDGRLLARYWERVLREKNT